MALIPVLSQQNVTPFNQSHYSFSEVYYNASGDTVVLPAVPLSAAALAEAGNTAPTVTTSSGSSTVTLTGGTVGARVIVVSRNSGSAAGVNAAGVGE
jgi:hypothetical protein